MSPAHMALPMLLAMLVAEQNASPFAPPPPVMTQDDIRAARKKFDRDMKLDTKRPWDGMYLTGPNAFEKKPMPDKK